MNNVFSGTPDTGLARESAGVLKVTNGASGYGTLDAGGLSINGTALATVLAGDVTGAFGANTVSKIQGQAVSSTAPTNGQVLEWTGSQWAPGTMSGALISVFGRTGAVTANTGDYSYSQISGSLPDAALPSDAVTSGTLGNSTLAAALTSLTTTSDITSGGALTATGNIYANSGSNTAGCLHLADTMRCTTRESARRHPESISYGICGTQWAIPDRPLLLTAPETCCGQIWAVSPAL